jgi:hypothetical protein
MDNSERSLTTEDLEHFREQEEKLWRAETRFDNTLMDKLFADDFFEFGRSGKRYSRSELLFEPGQFSEINASLPFKEFDARRLSNDVVLVTYISEVTYGEDIERANRSSIWSKANGEWRLRFHQGTPLA